MNPVVHFELPAEDPKRMSGFYARVFGWKTQQLGPEMGNYVLVRTTETAENGFPMKKVAAAGGKVLGGQKPGQLDDIPGFGLYAAFLDTEGNRLGMLQPKDMEGAAK